MNFLSYLRLLLTTTVDDIHNEVSENIRLTRNLIMIALIVPGVLLIVGIVVGLVESGINGAEHVVIAPYFIGFAAFIATVLLALVWVRAAVFAEIVLIGSRVGSLVIPQLNIVNQNEVKSRIQWLRGLVTWIAGACLWAMIVPVWREPKAFLVAVVCILILFLASGWFKTSFSRYILVAVALVVFLGTFVILLAPGFAKSARSYADATLNRANSKAERDDRLIALDAKGSRDEAESAAKLTDDFLEERKSIRDQAARRCGGEYCSDGDRSRDAQIGEALKQIHDGTYWENKKQKAVVPPVPSAPLTSAGESDTHSDDAHRPPPPDVVPVDPSLARRSGGSATPSASSDTLDEVFSECQKYPTLCGKE